MVADMPLIRIDNFFRKKEIAEKSFPLTLFDSHIVDIKERMSQLSVAFNHNPIALD